MSQPQMRQSLSGAEMTLSGGTTNYEHEAKVYQLHADTSIDNSQGVTV
jgi:hypothetical protein